MDNKLSIKETFAQGISLTKSTNKGLFIGLLISFLILDIASDILKRETSSSYGILVPFIMAYVYAYYKCASQGLKTSEVPKLIKPFVWKILLTSILQGILLVPLFIAVIIPGIIFLIYWNFYIFIILDQKVSGFKALSESKKMIKGNWWKIFAIVVISSLLIALVIIPLLFLPQSILSTALISIVSTVTLFLSVNIMMAAYLRLLSSRPVQATTTPTPTTPVVVTEPVTSQ